MLIPRRLKILLVTVFVLFAFGLLMADEAFSAWFNPDWNYRKKITINSSQVPVTQANFPVLVEITGNFLKTVPVGNVGKANGGDILFTDLDGITKRDHEIENYNGATGNLTAWVELPLVSASTDTEFYMYYGNSGAADQWNMNGTWDEGGAFNYVGVWHLKESSGNLMDSTGSAAHGTRQGSTVAAGKIATGQQFVPGESDHVYLGGRLGFQWNHRFAVSAWVKRASTGSGQVIISRNDSNNRGWQFSFNGSNNLAFNIIEGCCWPPNWAMTTSTAETITDTNWHHVAVYYPGDGLGSTVAYYIDGVQATTQVGISPIDQLNNFSNKFAAIGANYGGTNAFFDGAIDEVRVAFNPGFVRAADWFQTSFNNQNSPSSFLSPGIQESFASIPTMTEWGMIVFMLFAALGAVYYLKKYSRT